MEHAAILFIPSIPPHLNCCLKWLIFRTGTGFAVAVQYLKTMPVQTISVPQLPPNNDTYSQAVRLGEVIYVSGQLGVRPDGALADGLAAQTRQAIENIAMVLAAAGSEIPLVAKVNIFVTDFSRLGEMNEVYREYFTHCPAKTTVEIARLDRNALIEIEVIASAR